ncbi:MAG: hypothetical protein A2Z25_06065 [Planctomycetes bacterium RBG_16_55_9]|nr:MAG: hypothetical protein A2Z25_06065 [Planctomycetes bacterium RBG_16_55_9]
MHRVSQNAASGSTTTMTRESNTQTVSEIIEELRSIAVHSLARMYRPEERLFAFRLRKNGRSEILEGVSRRYTAMALIGLAGEDPCVVTKVLGRHRPQDVCARLFKDLDRMKDLGEVALTTWAIRALDCSQVSTAVEALRRMEPGRRPYPTMELSWALAALVIDGRDAADASLADNIAEALLASFNRPSGIFARWSAGSKAPKFRAHASCFANFVYPIQSLSYYHLATGNMKAIEAAVRCAERMCQLQGPEGQWWWYYDSRTGRVLERYPVYAVHQDAMAPMALFALEKAIGRDYHASIEKGLRWLIDPAEVSESLIDSERNIVWRKVARREPWRITRALQTASSYLHPSLRVPGVDVLFPPCSIDYETRPYHMGWILHAWPSSREKKSVTQVSLLEERVI